MKCKLDLAAPDGLVFGTACPWLRRGLTQPVLLAVTWFPAPPVLSCAAAAVVASVRHTQSSSSIRLQSPAASPTQQLSVTRTAPYVQHWQFNNNSALQQTQQLSVTLTGPVSPAVQHQLCTQQAATAQNGKFITQYSRFS
jgi:hypothetical protein